MEIRKQLIELFLLKDELEYFHQSLTIENNPFIKYRLIKQNLTALNTFLESLSNFNKYINNNQELKELSRNLRRKGGLISHMRNKIGGHLDNDLLKRAAQWTPYIFHKLAKENRNLQIGLCYKSILEASINSYIDLSNNDKVKMFETEIDLSFPPDEILFFNFIGNINLDTIKWIETVIEIIEKDFIYFDNEELFIQSKLAGLTDFNLKNKFQLPEQSQLKNNALIKLCEETFIETDNTKKIEHLNNLIKIIEEKIKIASK